MPVPRLRSYKGALGALLRGDVCYIWYWWQLLDANETDCSGRTLLMHACATGDETFVRLLVDNGAKLMATDDRGVTVGSIVHGIEDHRVRTRIARLVDVKLNTRRSEY